MSYPSPFAEGLDAIATAPSWRSPLDRSPGQRERRLAGWGIGSIIEAQLAVLATAIGTLSRLVGGGHRSSEDEVWEPFMELDNP